MPILFSAALSGGGGATRLGRSEETNGRRTCQISLLVGGSDCVWGMWDQFGGKGGGGISRCCKAYHTYTQKRRLTAKIDPAASRRWQRPHYLSMSGSGPSKSWWIPNLKMKAPSRRVVEGLLPYGYRGVPIPYKYRGVPIPYKYRGVPSLQDIG